MAEILYQGHGSFRLTTSEGSVIYIDPYAGEGYDRPADLVLVSHEHHDHNAVELVKRKEDGKILRAGDVLKDGVYQEIRACGVKIKGTQAYNKNHPKDQCVGFVVEMEGKIVFVRKKGKRKFGKNNRALTISKKDWNLSLPSR